MALLLCCVWSAVLCMVSCVVYGQLCYVWSAVLCMLCCVMYGQLCYVWSAVMLCMVSCNVVYSQL